MENIYTEIYNFIANFFPNTGFENTIKYISIGIGLVCLFGLVKSLFDVFKYIIKHR